MEPAERTFDAAATEMGREYGRHLRATRVVDADEEHFRLLFRHLSLRLC